MMLMPEIKAELRRVVLARRDGLDPSDRARASDRIARFAEMLAPVSGQVVAGFWPIRSEIDPRPTMEKLAQAGAHLALPAVIDRQTILFRRYAPGQTLKASGFGTMAPPPDAEIAVPDLVLLPLAAFDAAGNRLGYGAGHYDRAIAAIHAGGRMPRLVGVAFAVQRVENIPTGAHDIPLDAVLTENGLHRFVARR